MLTRSALHRFVCFLLALSLAFQVAAQTPKKSQDKSARPAEKSSTEKPAQEIDWGEWDSSSLPKKAFGVGIQGKVEEQINQLDKSNLLDSGQGVATRKPQENDPKAGPNKRKDLKKMMAELQAMEQKVDEEIEDESEF